MEIISLEPCDSDKEHVKLACPVCDTPWLYEEDDEPLRGECEHLRFVWCYDCIEYYGSWDTDNFENAYRKAHYDLEQDDYILDGSLGNAYEEVLETVWHQTDEPTDVGPILSPWAIYLIAPSHSPPLTRPSKEIRV